MKTHRLTACSLVMLLALTRVASAQVESQSAAARQHVEVRIVFTDGGACDTTAKAALWRQSGAVAEGRVDEDCVADLGQVADGRYHLSVSGKSFVRIDTDSIEINSFAAEPVEVKVGRGESPRENAEGANARVVAISNLGIPARARKEFNKGVEFMARHDWADAIAKLNRAIGMHPEYAAAYNDLGVVYGQMGDRARESAALQKAIAVNDHFAPAYVNLARLKITMDDFAEAERLLNQAAIYDARDAATLVLLSYVEFKDGRFDDVIATAARAHALPQNHAYVHWMAARAMAAQQNRTNEMRSELRLFLQEEPTGARAEQARQELAGLNGAGQ